MLTADNIREHAPRARCFIETGYGEGLGVQAALDAGGFDEIHSIELSPGRVGEGRARFSREPRVRIHEGDSRRLLGPLVRETGLPCLVWIDAHGGGGSGAGGFETALEDLQQLPEGDHVILVDDLRRLSASLLKDVCVELKRINPAYRLEIVDSGLRAPNHDLRFDILKASVWTPRVGDALRRIVRAIR